MVLWMTSFSIAIWAAEKGAYSDISKVLEDSVYSSSIGPVSLVDTVIMAGLVELELLISSLNSSKAC
jgi:hypothetical protein